MKKSRNRLERPFGIARATVSFAATGERYTHPELSLYDAQGDAKIRVRFQAHRLDMSDPCGGRNTAPAPSDRFDFGFPYSACYAARWHEGSSYGFGSLKAEPMRSTSDALRMLARFHDLIEKTGREFNLVHVEPNCELSLWVATLEKLGVPVEINRWVGQRGQKLDTYGWRHSLPEDQQHPARDHFEQAADQAEQAEQRDNG